MPQYKVVFKDRWLIVIDKPFGLPSQRGRDEEDGVYEMLSHQHPYVGLHHRLDRPASGLLLFTLNRRANRAVSVALKDHDIKRGYLGVAVGNVRSGDWSTPVEEKTARSSVEVVGQGSGLSALKISLHTGRKHQIRVQAAMNGTPLAGDHRYGGEAAAWSPRLALHASFLEFQHPITKTKVTVNSELPDDLASLWRLAS